MPLTCSAYFSKFSSYTSLAVPCHSKRRPSPFVLVSHPGRPDLEPTWLELDEYIH